MRKLSLYIDSSVWNMRFDDHVPELQEFSRLFFNAIERGGYNLYIAEAIFVELRHAPEPRRTALLDLVQKMNPHMLEVTPEVVDLAQAYLTHNILPPSAELDAYHVAFATVNQIDVVVSWNFRHLANIKRRSKIVAFNLSLGYTHPIDIITPLEVIGDG